jgi:protein gp37
MGDHSTIEWTEATWNPVTGCDTVSPGCDHCYARTLAARLKAMGQARYQADGDPVTSGPGFRVTLQPDQLDLPNHWAKPRMIFVNSMSDLFHKDVPDAYVADVFGVIARNQRHTFQALTKRHGRMRSLLRSDEFIAAVARRSGVQEWPLRNLWLGVSAEDQARADLRLGHLLDTPAWVRWVSLEPLLGPVRLGDADQDALNDGGLNWVVVGGESGAGHRPIDPRWAADLRDECVDAGVPFFFKQWGGIRPKSGGRLLDGRTWDELPLAAAAH